MLVKNQPFRIEADQQSAPPAVEVERLTKKFGADFRALDDVSVSIRQGEFFSLLGPSGCGKTTLLRIIGGFEAPTRGNVRIDGRSVIHQPPNQRATNMIFQHLALFPHMSVAENVAFGLKMRKVADAETKARVREALAMVRLEGFGDREIEQLSGGQKQRVAIARALVNQPSVLLLDEPLGALDLQLRIQMHSELRRLHSEIGNTFIFVTHDQGEALTLSDRVAVMNAAKIVQIGTPEAIYERPETRFVASFVGHTNLFDGRVAGAQRNKGYMVETDNGLRIAVDSKASLSQGQPVSLGIRYEKVRLVRGKAGKAAAVSFGGTVRERTYLGSQIRFLVAIDDSAEAQIVADLPADSEGRSIGPGDQVTMSWQRDAANLFTE